MSVDKIMAAAAALALLKHQEEEAERIRMMNALKMTERALIWKRIDEGREAAARARHGLTAD